MNGQETNAHDDQVSDETLIVDAQKGDQDAFGRLYKRHLDPVYRYIYYRIGNHQDSEDLTDSVFIKAWKAIDKYEVQGTPFLAWLYRIARNVVIDFTRKRKFDQVDIDDQYSLSAVGTLPEDAVANALQMKGVMNALDRLKPIEREIVTLRFLMGMSHQEIAQIVDKKPGTVRVTQLRALKTLKVLLEADGIGRMVG